MKDTTFESRVELISRRQATKTKRFLDEISNSRDPLKTLKTSYMSLQLFSNCDKSRISTHIHLGTEVFAKTLDISLEEILVRGAETVYEAIEEKRELNGRIFYVKDVDIDLLKEEVRCLINTPVDTPAQITHFYPNLKAIMRRHIADCHGLLEYSEKPGIWTASYTPKPVSFSKENHHKVARVTHSLGFKNYSTLLAYTSKEYIDFLKFN